MASIYTTVDIDVDIEIDEFVDSCSSRDIENLLKYLSNQGYLTKFGVPDETKMTSQEESFTEKMSMLSLKYHQLSIDDIDTLEKLFNKYI